MGNKEYELGTLQNRYSGWPESDQHELENYKLKLEALLYKHFQPSLKMRIGKHLDSDS
jgi:hypothetical protein